MDTPGPEVYTAFPLASVPPVSIQRSARILIDETTTPPRSAPAIRQPVRSLFSATAPRQKADSENPPDARDNSVEIPPAPSNAPTGASHPPTDARCSHFQIQRASQSRCSPTPNPNPTEMNVMNQRSEFVVRAKRADNSRALCDLLSVRLLHQFTPHSAVLR